MPNPEKQVMSAQTLHKRPPKLHLGHEETSSADEINNPNEFNQCNVTVGMSSSPSTPTTPSTPSSPAISKPPKKRYLENGSFRCTDDQNPSQMANLMELAKVCSNTTKAPGSLFCNSNTVRDSSNKSFGQSTDFQANVNYTQTRASGVALSDISTPSGISSYNQIPIFDVDIAGRIRDSDLFERSGSSPSGSAPMSDCRPEEPLNLCTDKKTIRTCQQDLISRMVDKFFCDPNESKGTLLDSFLLRMNSRKKLAHCDKNNKTADDLDSSDGEVECVAAYGTAKPRHKGEKKDDADYAADGVEDKKTVESKPLPRKWQSEPNSSCNQTAPSKTVEKLQNVCDDYVLEANASWKEGQRKSQRSSKGKRYRAFLTEGFLHPSKERKTTKRSNGEESELKPGAKCNKKRKAAETRTDGERRPVEDVVRRSSGEDKSSGARAADEAEAKKRSVDETGKWQGPGDAHALLPPAEEAEERPTSESPPAAGSDREADEGRRPSRPRKKNRPDEAETRGSARPDPHRPDSPPGLTRTDFREEQEGGQEPAGSDSRGRR